MTIQVFQRADDRWLWALHGPDGVPLAASRRAFSTSVQAMRDGEAVVGRMGAPVVEDGGYIAIPPPAHLEGSVLRP